MKKLKDRFDLRVQFTIIIIITMAAAARPAKTFIIRRNS